MGQKVNPVGMRVGVNRDWNSRWYANDNEYHVFLNEDIKIRKYLEKSLKEALGILANTNKAASEPVTKLIKSAAANAVNNFGMDEDSLYIAEIWANDGLRMKRYLPRAKGSASGLVKRNCHLTVVVKMR